MATYDMTPLDAKERIPIKIHIINKTLNINTIKMVSIALNFNVAELKFEIERELSIKQKHQSKLSIMNVASNKDDIDEKKDKNQELNDDDIKLSQYDIKQNSIIQLILSDDSDWNNNKNNIQLQSIPVAAAAASVSPADTIHFLTKHSRIECRILLIVFEISLVLLVVYFGEISMIQYLINIILILIGWRGCRKLKPFWILCYLFYLILDTLIIFLYIIFGIVNNHESVYGHTAVYISLLSIEFVLYVIWIYFFTKFFWAVLKANDKLRSRARTITSKQAILI